MKRVVFVNPPNHQVDNHDLAPPLGLMVLSMIARRCGWVPQIIDLSLGTLDEDAASRFYQQSCQQILDAQPMLLCFTSMGVNTHVALELAQSIKEIDRSIVICVGGVHFTSIATYLRSTCPWIDIIVLGEGERSFEQLLARSDLTGNHEFIETRKSEALGGITHPHEIYDLIVLADYFNLNPRKVINYEGGRGCIFKCSFCYSPSQYVTARSVPPKQIVDDWTKLANVGARHIFMVQDNFTNSPKEAINTCNVIASADLPLTWNGYATLPQLTGDVIKALGLSKCRQIYLGIDAVSARQAELFNKRFYKGSGQLKRQLQALGDQGVQPTCAFMLDLFNFNDRDNELVFRVAAECASVGASIRFNTFTRYPGSALGEDTSRVARYSESKVRIMFDCPKVVRQNRFARVAPSEFPFHSTELNDESVWERQLKVVWLAQRLIQKYPDDFLQMSDNARTQFWPGFDRLVSELGLLGTFRYGTLTDIKDAPSEVF